MTLIDTTGPGGEIIGCMDPIANNYDPNATVNSDCQYGNQFVGCTDPLAINYQPAANIDCFTIIQTQGIAYLNSLGLWNDGTSCCMYTTTTTTTTATTTTTTPDIVIISDPIDGTTTQICPGPYSISQDNVVIGIESAECCSKTNTQLGAPTLGYQYYWDGKTCKLIPECPASTTCIDCVNFDWWNDTYISSHNGQSLSVTSPFLWQQMVDLVTNSGRTVSVNTINGELITEDCCEGVFKNGICFCEQIVEEDYAPRCISNLNDFLNLISDPKGYSFFTTNFQTIGPSLGLTTQQINFILLNINNTLDNNSNGIQDLTEARLILSNALNATGGFHVNFGVITNTPILVNKGVCDQNGGYWDGPGTATSQTIALTSGNDIQVSIEPNHNTTPTTINLLEVNTLATTTPNTSNNGNCMCKPVFDQCEIDITQVETVSAFDFFNNNIQLVQLTADGTPLTEACCNRLIKDYNLPWEWQAPYCLATKRDDCLPFNFSLNDKLMEVPPCENDLEISMWVYFSKPNNPCQPIPDPPDTDIIVIDGQYCDITLTPNTGAIVPNVSSGANIGNSTPKVEVTATNVSGTTKTCCYSIYNPILAKISLTDSLLNSSLTQIKEFNSSADYFDKWVQIKATLPSSGLTLTFGVNLEIYQGLNCCCDYDFFIDDIMVDCTKQEPSLIVNDIECPGFNLTKVIDNKKSWVYNPGIPSVGISVYDEIERNDGSFGTLNGEGTINRTFAPSLDASIPWRYTDYWQQSSVYEKHSNLVLNSKELWLTYDMCADCPISGTTLTCPQGYTLSANTQICYSGTT